MPFSINIPPLVRRPRSASQPHSFRRLRSFYLSPSATTQHPTEFSDLATLSPISGATTSAPNTPLSAAFTQGGPSSSYHRSPQSHSTTSVHAPAAATADSCSERTLTREGPVCNGDVQGKWSPPGAYGSLSRVYGAKRPRRMRGTTVMLCVAVLSVFLVMCISLTFIGADAGEGAFKRVLDGVAANDPGIVLVGESVDVDIDEPSVDIRWSILACGEGLVLPQSGGALGSVACGLPVEGLDIYIDSQDTPVATYDPSLIPYHRTTGHRSKIESLLKFTTTHPLNVRKARLYPFDTYTLASSFRATRSASAATQRSDSLAGALNQTVAGTPVRIVRIVTVGITTNFDVEAVDEESYVDLGMGGASSSVIPTSSTTTSAAITSMSTSTSSTSSPMSTATNTTALTTPPHRRREDPTRLTIDTDTVPPTPGALPSRDLTLSTTRPPSAQMFVLLLFTTSWLLAHLSIALAVVARRSANPSLLSPSSASLGGTRQYWQLAVHVGALASIVILRRGMPDGPGLDGVLLDCIGFFPQLSILGLCIATSLLRLAAADLDAANTPNLTGDSVHSALGIMRDGWGDYAVDMESGLSSPEEVGRGQHAHCCRASIISSFPQPPSGTPFPAGGGTGTGGPTRSPGSGEQEFTFTRHARSQHHHHHACTLSSSSAGADLGSHTMHHRPPTQHRWNVSTSRGRSRSGPPASPTSPTWTSGTGCWPTGGQGGGFLSPQSPTQSPTSGVFPPVQSPPVQSPTGGGSLSPQRGFGFAAAFFGGPPARGMFGAPARRGDSGDLKRGGEKSAEKKKKNGSTGSGSSGKSEAQYAGWGRGVDVELALRRKGSARRAEEGEGEVSRWSDHEDE
ncbi:hypothetical protein D9611_007486 [Ephemerocybe angulata]|uniref:Uncharacterized protein n=1 Tax=Ephemerocybe angulata TaxID=980116 RepID=A0A8H5CHF0_9AGAR|nr:hypothetical protein D9611_007486 [Tulosesus angulatus]